MRPTDPQAPPMNVNVHTDVAREEKDVRISALVGFGFWLSVVLITSLVALWGLFRLFAAQERRAQRTLASGVAASLKRTPSEPRLEPLPLAPRAALRAFEDARLSSYGWVDRTGGVARIPIDRAMELIVEKGVPGGRPFPPPPISPAAPPAPASAPASTTYLASPGAAPR